MTASSFRHRLTSQIILMIQKVKPRETSSESLGVLTLLSLETSFTGLPKLMSKKARIGLFLLISLGNSVNVVSFG